MRYLITFFILVYSHPAAAGLLDVYRLEDGHTNWQYVANTAGGLLILTLIYSVIRLLLSRRQARSYNRKLEAARNQLEQRVQERTATLDESNRMLQESNKALLDEIKEHRKTTSQLRQSEAYINNILRSMPLMLVGLNENSEITHWNPRAEEISGLPASRALGQNLWQAYPTITISPEQIERAQKLSKTITIKHSQRGQYYFDITIYPLGNQDNTGVIILIDDVTQRVLAENMLIQRDKMSSMGELAAAMAIDIDSPLQAILGDVRDVQTALGNGAAAPAQLNPLLADALARGRQVSSVINNLLEFSQARGGEKKEADICGIIDHSLTLANDLLTAPSGLKFQDITIEKHYGENLPQIPCYAAELQQVFLSLFRHACGALGEVDRGGDHTPTITIHVNESYDALWVKVNHNGKGISLEEQKYILEPFFTNDVNDLSSEKYDAGKRLSFSHFIVTEQHRGEMAVTSDIDLGTTFHMQLQLKK